MNKALSSKVFYYFFCFLLVITVVCVFIPFEPQMPFSGLDSSWAVGMAHAAANAFDFGEQITFTFGPYASVYTRFYQPIGFDRIMLAAATLGCSYSLAVLRLASQRKTTLLIGFTLFFAVGVYLRDALFFSYPLLVGLCAYRLITEYELKAFQAERKQRGEIALLVFLLIPFGLLPLIKGSLFVLCVAVVGLVVLLTGLYRRWWLVLAVMVIPVLSLMVFWLLASQPLFSLPMYLWNMLPIISGYSSAMATTGKLPEVIGFFLVSLVSLIMLCRAKSLSSIQRGFLCSLLFVYLFLVFKGSFVRHDIHATTAGSALVLAMMALVFMPFGKQFMVLLLPAFMVWGYIDAGKLQTSTQSAYHRLKNTYQFAANGINNRLNHPEYWQRAYQTSLAHAHKANQIPKLDGTVDIYPHHQVSLLASGNAWQPRPIFQSYSAYTPKLLAHNRDHLLSEQAPDYVIFKVDPIDGRLPMLADGSSWFALLDHYQPLEIKGDFLYLKQSDNNKLGKKISKKQTVIDGSLDKPILLPDTSQPLMAKIMVKPSLLGRLVGVFYKSSQLRIILTLANGQVKSYRHIASMGASPFMLSPLVDSTAAFAALYQPQSPLLAKQRVVSLKISPVSKPWLWQSVFTIVLNSAEQR